MRLKLQSILVATQFMAAQIFASIPFHDRGISLDLNLVSNSHSEMGIDFSRIARIRPEGFSYEYISRLLPTDIPASASGSQVASQIADNSMRAYFNSESFKATNFGKTSHNVEKSMRQNVTISGSSPASIKHDFKFNMQATQTKAVIDYKGFTNAQLSYTASSQELNFEVFRKLSNNMKIAYNHINSSGDQRDIVSLNLGF